MGSSFMPQGGNLLILERTFGVLTKLDLIDQGTNALDVLKGRSYHLQHPWVGIVNCSQAEINKNIDMIDARRKVQEYFASSPDYGHLESKMGSEYLAKLLSKVLAANVVALAWNVILSFKAHKEVVLK